MMFMHMPMPMIQTTNFLRRVSLSWMTTTTSAVITMMVVLEVVAAASSSTSTSTSRNTHEHSPIFCCFSMPSSSSSLSSSLKNTNHLVQLPSKILFHKQSSSHHPLLTNFHRSKQRSRSCLFLLSEPSPRETSASTKNNNSDGNSDDVIDWTLEQDWALLDAVPQFTVVTELEARTFWVQLWMSTPILFSKLKVEPEDLYDRMVVLRRQRDQKEQTSTKKDDDQRRKTQPFKMPHFGPSPPILQNWSTTTTSTEQQRITGQTDHDGRTVWFSYHLIGRLKDDLTSSPVTDVNGLDGFRMIKCKENDHDYDVAANGDGGGCRYVEAVGGRVYELGNPRRNNAHNAHAHARFGMTSLESSSTTNHHDEKDSLLRWDGWISAGTATLSALLATTVLSMLIGYCAGLSIIHDNAMNQQQHYETQQQQSPSTSYQRPIPASRAIVRVSSSTASTIIRSEPSQEELRVKAQYRVLHEQRLLEHISQRLEQDQQTLQRLDEESSARGITTTETTTLKTNMSP